MEAAPGLTQAEIEALFSEAAEPAVAFLYDDKVREALAAQLRDLTGCSPVWARLGLWAMQQAAAGLAANGTQWLVGKTASGVARIFLRCPGANRLVRGLRQLCQAAQDDVAFRDEIKAIARGDRDPDLSGLPNDAPEDVQLVLRLLVEVNELGIYLPGEFDALQEQIGHLRKEAERLERIEALLEEATSSLRRQYEARIAGLEQQRQLDRDTIAAQNAALHALAAQAGQSAPAPGIEEALRKASRGDTRAAEALLADVGNRKAQEHGSLSDKARRAAAEAAEAFRHQGALAQVRSVTDALNAYRRAAELDPQHCWTWIFLCRLELEAGDLPAAERAAAQARATATEQRDCAAALHEVGDVSRAQGDLAKALDAYEEAHQLFDQLAATSGDNSDQQRDLATSWDKLGDVRRYQGELKAAARAYSASQIVATRLAVADPIDPVRWRDLSVTWEN